MSYTPPIDAMRFALEAAAGLERLRDSTAARRSSRTCSRRSSARPASSRATWWRRSTSSATASGRGSRTASCARRRAGSEAYRAFVEGGWNGLPFEPAHGGQGMPWALATAVHEMWQSANLAFALCPLLTAGATDLLQAHGSDAQKAKYLPHMIAGTWTGSMNLTEPQAGSDVGALKTRAVRENGHYRITGQKIFITYGDHDLAENIVHMVLARTP
jgi:3-(methylthio)propanoyl-CoA dehydrogenase